MSSNERSGKVFCTVSDEYLRGFFLWQVRCGRVRSITRDGVGASNYSLPASTWMKLPPWMVEDMELIEPEEAYRVISDMGLRVVMIGDPGEVDEESEESEHAEEDADHAHR